MSCSRIHGPDDPCLGEPLCPDCFDYEGAVIWNNLLGELWRYTTIYLPRKLAKLLGITQKRLHELVRVSYVKVVGVPAPRPGASARRHPPGPPDARLPQRRDPAAGQAVYQRAARASAPDDRRRTVKVKIPDELGAGDVRWGKQLDVQQLPVDEPDRRRWASYLAKYTTKSTEQAGGLLHRVDRSEVEHVRGVRSQPPLPHHRLRPGRPRERRDRRRPTARTTTAGAAAGARQLAATPTS